MVHSNGSAVELEAVNAIVAHESPELRVKILNVGGVEEVVDRGIAVPPLDQSHLALVCAQEVVFILGTRKTGIA